MAIIKPKIGVFDSGIGGQLIAEKIRRALPQATVIFKSDSEFFPYGDKPQSFILRRSIAMTKKLVAKGCQLIIIACNAATTNTINALRQKFPSLTFVGVEPPVKPTVTLSRTKKIAIMATPATITSHRFREIVRKYANKVTPYSIACHGLAEQIETRVKSHRSLTLEKTIRKFLDQPVKAGVDVVGLGCTHYPYLLPQLKKLYPQVTFYDPADAVVAQVKKLALSDVGR